MSSIDLLIRQGDRSDELAIFLQSPDRNDAFSVLVPERLIQLHQSWSRRFLIHHDPAQNNISADVLSNWGQRLTAAMADLVADPIWHSLQKVLNDHPDLPLRLQIERLPLSITKPDANRPTPSVEQLAQRDDLLAVIERLPWEALTPNRPLWRLNSGRRVSNRPSRQRQPRLLLVMGHEEDLDLSSELEQLTGLQRRGRIQLHTLRGQSCNFEALRRALVDPRGWDGLIFLGHSESNAQAGGKLQLGDGNWIAAESLRDQLHQAAQQGLALVLLNSCSGIDLARTCTTAGIDWAVCFRESLPSAAASRAFTELLLQLQQGSTLLTALQAVRQDLAQGPYTDCQLLLSAYATNDAAPFQLPLRKRRQFVLRLAKSKRNQAIAAAFALSLGVVADLAPWNPISRGLLDHRLRIQRQWRLRTHQPGPTATAMPVLLLDRRHAYPALGISATQPGNRLSRRALLAVLQRANPERLPKIGLDVVLDEPGSDPGATAQLASLIAEQRRPQLFAGFFGANTNGPMPGNSSEPLLQLKQAGLKAYNLSVGTPAASNAGQSSSSKTLPLQLAEAIDAGTFSHALAAFPDRYLPVDAVIDWSLDWQPLLQRVEPEQLGTLSAQVLLVGSDGQIDPQHPDLFDAPAVIRDLLPAWGGSNRQLPGALVQAVLAQSLNLNHWLSPLSTAFSTAAAAGLGVLLAAAQQRRMGRGLLVGAIIVIVVPIALQLAVSPLALLVPLLLPLAALTATTFLRSE